MEKTRQTDNREKEILALAELAVAAGERMLRSGAETYRVEDTMSHILQTDAGLEADTVAYTTSLLVTVREEGRDPISIVRRVKSRGTNLKNIVQVNELSRRFCEGELDVKEAKRRLDQIGGKAYSRLWYNLGTVGVVVGFALFFGGSLRADAPGALIVGAVLAALITAGKKLKFNDFFSNVWAGMGIAFSSILLKNYMISGMNLDTIIISGIMPLVPGVAITNAVRDTLQGDYLSGAARILEAFLIAASVAIGVGMGMAAAAGLMGKEFL